MSRAVKSGDNHISLQLNPNDLGQVTIKLDIQKNGSVTGTVVADNPDTLASLIKDQRSLEKSLNDAGLKADTGSLHFSLGQNHEQANRQAAHKENGASLSSRQSLTESAIEGTTMQPIETEIYHITPSRVNIRV